MEQIYNLIRLNLIRFSLTLSLLLNLFLNMLLDSSFNILFASDLVQIYPDKTNLISMK